MGIILRALLHHPVVDSRFWVCLSIHSLHKGFQKQSRASSALHELCGRAAVILGFAQPSAPVWKNIDNYSWFSSWIKWRFAFKASLWAVNQLVLCTGYNNYQEQGVPREVESLLTFPVWKVGNPGCLKGWKWWLGSLRGRSCGLFTWIVLINESLRTSEDSATVWALSELWSELGASPWPSPPPQAAQDPRTPGDGPDWPPSRAGTPRAGDTGTHPAGIWMDPDMPQLPGQLFQRSSSCWGGTSYV